MPESFRVATSNDVAAVVDTLALAFRDDPVWGMALTTDDSSELQREFWRFYVDAAVEYSTVFVIDDLIDDVISEGVLRDDANADIAAAVAVWVPPGGEEMSESQDAELRQLVAARLPPRSVSALEDLWDRFESNHPHDPEHAYLSLLATHPSRRGHGIAQRLLADNLAHWDALGVPAYLESTNPANDHRYGRLGFRPIGVFTAVLTDAAVTTMWRDARTKIEAGVPGLEPRTTEPESAVLPITPYPIENP